MSRRVRRPGGAGRAPRRADLVTTDADGAPHRGRPRTSCVAILAGARASPVGRPTDAAAALRATSGAAPSAGCSNRCWSTGSAAPASVAAHAARRRATRRTCGCTLELEDGDVRRRRSTSARAMSAATAAPWSTATVRRYAFDLGSLAGDPIPPGLPPAHAWMARTRATVALSWPPRLPGAPRGWGAFLPLHALRTEDDWGVGSYTDLARSARWVGGLGGGLVGTLPLYPAFLDATGRPEPLPAREPAGLQRALHRPHRRCPSWPLAPRRARLLDSDGFRHRLSAVHRVAPGRLRGGGPAAPPGARADGRRRLRGRLPIAGAEFEAVRAATHPELVAYARFRAGREQAGRRPVAGRPDDRPAADVGYHLYAQWGRPSSSPPPAPRSASTPTSRSASTPTDSIRVWAPELLRPGRARGRPARPLLRRRPELGFPPAPPRTHAGGRVPLLHRPSCARPSATPTTCAIDHVMGCTASTGSPRGSTPATAPTCRTGPTSCTPSCRSRLRAGHGRRRRGPGHGARRRCGARMAEDHMLRSWVLQFESTPDDPLPAAARRRRLASLGHPRPAPLRRLLLGRRHRRARARRDASTRRRPARSASERARVARASCSRDCGLGARPTIGGSRSGRQALRACLSHWPPARPTRAGRPRGLWGERAPQNHPGTGPRPATGAGGAARTLRGGCQSDPAVAAVLRRLDRTPARRHDDRRRIADVAR